MKMKKTFTEDIFIWIFFFLSGMLGIYIGLITIQKYEVVVSGLSGLATIYLVNLLFFPPKDFFKSMPGKVLSLKTIKYSVMCFLICLILSWSLRYFIDSLFYILKDIALFL